MPRTGILSGSRRGSTVAGLLDDALGVFAAREVAAEVAAGLEPEAGLVAEPV